MWIGGVARGWSDGGRYVTFRSSNLDYARAACEPAGAQQSPQGLSQGAEQGPEGLLEALSRPGEDWGAPVRNTELSGLMMEDG